MGAENGTLDKFQSPLHPWHDFGIAIFMVLTGLVSMVGNTLAVLVFTSKGRETTVPELFLLNIAVLDLILAFASYPAVTVSAFAHKWLFGDTGCAIYAAVCYFLGLATIMSLATLAAVRYVKTCLPNLSHRIDVRFAKSAFLGIYLYSLFWALLPFMGWGGYGVEPFGISCTLEWIHFDIWGQAHIVTLSTFCVFLPTIVIITSHVAILIRVRQTGRVIASAIPNRRGNHAERQLLLTSVGICAGFLIAWLPYAVISLYAAFGDSQAIPTWATPIPVMLAKSSIAYNPVIYVCCSKRYRVEFMSKLRYIACCPAGTCTGACPASGDQEMGDDNEKNGGEPTVTPALRTRLLHEATTHTNEETRKTTAETIAEKSFMEEPKY